jgi:arabinan endo-1,5-alpha-L-arabinosidase
MNLTSLLRLSAVALAIAGGSDLFQAGSPASPKAFQLEGDVEGTHDPSIIKDGDTWYLFATVTAKDSQKQIPIRCSKDLHLWKNCGFVFSQIPEWIKKESPETKDLWAPDISFFNGMYHLYYAFSIFGKNTSGIALLTNKTLDPQSANYQWKDEGLVVRSVASDDFNAIDPNLILDDKGGAWLAFGSFWSGIKMRRIDLKSGKLDSRDGKWYSLASRSHGHAPEAQRPDLPPDSQAIEAPFIVHHEGYYYLFVSFDLCCRGTKSDYKTMVGRSKEVMGPYIDASGRPMLQGGGTLLLSGNQHWVGPGGESILQDKDQDIMVFHAYDATSGRPSLQISPITWTSGWPRVGLEGNSESK